jgi:membrane protease YdiL (CAAX protease family)
MTELDTSNKTLFKYLGFTFGVGYVIQIFVWLVNNMNTGGVKLILSGAAQMIAACMMFVPLLAVLVSGQKLKGMGWKPVFKGSIPALLFSWFGPAILTAIGAVLYFVIFPSHFDVSGAYFVENGQEAALEQLETLGVTYGQQMLISSISAIAYAPLLNMIFAVGEEAGWRGYMYPVLKERFGRVGGSIFGGIIWGMWHWPMILLTGYEYGKDYKGFPIVGMVSFCVCTVFLGVLCDYVYEKSKCIWYPAIFHGAFNGAATIPLALAAPSVVAATRLLGPAPNGYIAGLPLYIVGAVILWKMKEKRG